MICKGARTETVQDVDYGEVRLNLKCDMPLHRHGKCRTIYSSEVVIFFDPQEGTK